MSTLHNNGFASPLPGACNMRRLLDDLHRRKKIIEQDQRDYEKVRRQIENADKQISQLELESGMIHKKGRELVEIVATKKTMLGFVEIKSKVVDESLKNSEKDLRKLLEQLHQTRMNCSELASSMLAESVKYAMVFNGTDLGHKNRRIELESQKHQLESELADFLCMKEGLQECFKERDDLEARHKQYDECDKEIMKEIKALNTTIEDLELEEYELVHSMNEKCKKLHQEIQEKEKFLAILQNKTKAGPTAKPQIHCPKPTVSSVKGSCSSRSQSAIDADWGRQSGIKLEKDEEISARNSNSRTLSKFQLPQKSQREVQKTPDSTELGDLDDFGESCSNDEDLCLAAAAEVSQRMRSYIPVTRTPSYEDFKTRGPPPSKVRILEKQPPITTFMRQFSSSKVIVKPKRPSSKVNLTSQSNAKVTVTTPDSSSRVKGNTSKNFQFKKKSVTNSNMESPTDPGKENLTLENSDDSNPPFAHGSAFPNESIFPSSTVENQEGTKEFFDDKPFSTFNASSILLGENPSQDNMQLFQ